ncbi:hypothetical protein CEXT_477351 [Caerostris extrusa]|uniref:Uncharacterized protein n=1 Tax=Caerostris extrusa TaxID=172846 RepID=A0AAV4QGE9_CAEEX|nr:hypothetical protein CEXT_477351 [Caerostris extrusa]
MFSSGIIEARHFMLTFKTGICLGYQDVTILCGIIEARHFMLTFKTGICLGYQDVTILWYAALEFKELNLEDSTNNTPVIKNFLNPNCLHILSYKMELTQ